MQGLCRDYAGTMQGLCRECIEGLRGDSDLIMWGFVGDYVEL